MRFIPFIFLVIFMYSSCSEKKLDYTSWEHYLGGPDRNHFSTLDQIHKGNLDSLEVSWVFESPDTGEMQMNPIIIGNTLYGVTASLRAFALNASSGELKWIYGDDEEVFKGNMRGVSYWEKEGNKRIFYAIGDQLVALSAETGKPIPSFGVNGKVDLHTGLPDMAQNKYIGCTSPGTIFEDLIIMPHRVNEDEKAAPGDIRAYSVIDGSLKWIFHVIPYPGEKGYETWENKEAYKNDQGIGGGNNWAGMTMDEETGIVYIPTGSMAPDFYGGNRKGNNLYSNCLLAIDALSGELIWYQQVVHHDIWDRDLPAPPNIIYVRHNGKKKKAVAQISKFGYVYLFDAKTGQPLFDLVETKTPKSELDGEETWPTQPIPVAPPSLSRRSDQLDTSNISPFAPNREELKNKMMASNLAYFAPPDTSPVFLLPGYDGGAEWGGAGADPENGILYINTNEMAWMLQMEEELGLIKEGVSIGEYVYLTSCAVCHQKDRKGQADSGFPSLVNIKGKYSSADIISHIRNGSGMMPGNESLTDEEVEMVSKFLLDIQTPVKEKVEVDPTKPPYRHLGYQKFLDQNGLPGIDPPWGTLAAVDMNAGSILWQRTFGQVDSLIDLGFPETGIENYGGPIITDNGLLIIAATKDEKIRIFDRESGTLLWIDELPASSFATPATYEVDGKQFIALACGGEKLGRKPGNKIIAYALKE